MGYYHEVFRVTCGACDSSYLFRPSNDVSFTKKWSWDCRGCSSHNWHSAFQPPQPNIPKELWIGPEKYNQLKIYPVPPGMGDLAWALPFSIRSFVYQVSRQLHVCNYEVEERGKVLDMPTFADLCGDWGNKSWSSWEPQEEPDIGACHLVSGWTNGQDTCPLWEQIGLLCQTLAERRFLHQYLYLAKDRHFPMLIPQVRIGIAQRRRPDFVVFVPVQKWKYKWYAIQLDAAHTQENAKKDELRDTEISVHGYEVINFRGENQGYWEDVRSLVETIERDMEEVESDPWGKAIQLTVNHTERAFPF